MKKIKIGDIFEIKTPEGQAYLHYIYNDKVIGDLIRVLPGLYSDRPAHFDRIASSKENFMVFFPLSAAYRRKIVELVGNYPAQGFEMPKYMRIEHNIRGEFLGWHIVDTQTWQMNLVKNLTEEQKKLSPWGVWNDTLLIEKLVNDWSLEKWG